MNIKISDIVNDSIVDGPGIRLTVFVQGCHHNCAGCHNPQTHDINLGKEVTIETIIAMVKNNPLLDGITLSGGEPFLQAKPCAILAEKVKSLGLNIWSYTGFTIEELLSSNDIDTIRLLKATDVLVDGKFEKNLRSLDLRFKGSKNQRLIDVGETLMNGNVVEID